MHSRPRVLRTLAYLASIVLMILCMARIATAQTAPSTTAEAPKVEAPKAEEPKTADTQKAEDPPTVHRKDYDTGSTTWIMVGAALVCFMIPGLAMFYGGMVRAKNVLNTMMACIAPIGVIGLIWVAIGYAIAFPTVPGVERDVPVVDAEGKEVMKDGKVVTEKKSVVDPSYFYFDKDLVFMKKFGATDEKTGVAATAVTDKADPKEWKDTTSYGGQLTSGDTYGAKDTGVPELAFFCFQGMFAIITPALIFGAIAERVKFAPYILFIALWSILVYTPVAHWVWNPAGWLFQKGVMDFAGGTVVHVLAGVSGLACCLVVGRRKGYDGKTPTAPHNVGMTLLGAAFLMVGWFGFNAASAIAVPGSDLPVAGSRAALAFTTTFLAAAIAGLAWMVTEWVVTKKPTALGFASGLVAGLVAITPCAGHVSPGSAVIIGLLGGIVCFFGCRIKYLAGYDDTLDAFGVHGIGGFLGALLVGLLAYTPLAGGGTQFGLQLQGAALSAVYAFVISLVLALAIKYTIGWRVKEEAENEGIDVNEHGEAGYHFN